MGVAFEGLKGPKGPTCRCACRSGRPDAGANSTAMCRACRRVGLQCRRESLASVACEEFSESAPIPSARMSVVRFGCLRRGEVLSAVASAGSYARHGVDKLTSTQSGFLFHSWQPLTLGGSQCHRCCMAQDGLVAPIRLLFPSCPTPTLPRCALMSAPLSRSLRDVQQG